MAKKEFRIVQSSEALLDEDSGEWYIQYRLQQKRNAFLFFPFFKYWDWVRQEVASAYVNKNKQLFTERRMVICKFKSVQEARDYCLDMFAVSPDQEINWSVEQEFVVP